MRCVDGRMLNFGSRDYGRRGNGDQKLCQAVREGPIRPNDRYGSFASFWPVTNQRTNPLRRSALRAEPVVAMEWRG